MPTPALIEAASLGGKQVSELSDIEWTVAVLKATADKLRKVQGVNGIALISLGQLGDAANALECSVAEIERMRQQIAILEVSAANCRRTHVTAGGKQVSDNNVTIISRIKGVPASPGTPETDRDPRNPNVPPEFAALGITEGESILVSRARYEALVNDMEEAAARIKELEANFAQMMECNASLARE